MSDNEGCTITGAALRYHPVDIFRIQNSEGKVVVTVRHDGQVEFGPGFIPDEAAKEFWVALGHYAPKAASMVCSCGSCQNHCSNAGE